jgi:hypothetical protein
VARDIGIDRLLGGTQVKAVPEILAGSAVHYLPFPGAPFEHPAKLAGSPVQVEDDCHSSGPRLSTDRLLRVSDLCGRS